MSDASRLLRLITFKVGPELFVLDIMSVRQIIPYTGSTPIPKAPDFIEGIIVLRDEVIPVVDLRSRLFPKLDAAEAPLVLVVRSAEGTIGLKVDQVLRILSVDMASILAPPEIVRGFSGEIFIGVIAQGESIYLLLDVETLLTTDEKRELRETDLDHAAAEAVGSAEHAATAD
jgi:purine-binding chemotaxis protein CheW